MDDAGDGAGTDGDVVNDTPVDHAPLLHGGHEVHQLDELELATEVGEELGPDLRGDARGVELAVHALLAGREDHARLGLHGGTAVTRAVVPHLLDVADGGCGDDGSCHSSQSL